MFSLYTDAATREDLALSTAGILIIRDGQQTPLKAPVEATDNHHAEFQAATLGFEAVLDRVDKSDRATTTVLFYTDSRIVADALGKGHAKNFQSETDALLQLQDQFGVVVTRWIPEKENRGAHDLALQALHARMN